MNVKKLYLYSLLRLFFNKKKHGHRPNAAGRFFLPLVPHPTVTWDSGAKVRPYYLNLRWVLRSFQGGHEPLLERFILQAIRPGDVIFDVGAQVGLIAVIAARTAGPDGHVYCFEPNGYNFQMLNQAIKENRLANVTTYRVGVGISPGRALFVEETLSGYSQQAEDPQSPATRQEGEQVELIRLDDFFEQNSLDRVDFIKVDIDGPDFEAILGAEKILTSAAPPMIALECSRFWSNFNHTFYDARDYLLNLGYKLYVCPRSHGGYLSVDKDTRLPDDWGTVAAKAINIYAYIPDLHQDRVKPLFFE